MENNKIDAYVKRLITLLAKKMDINISKYDMKELSKGMFVELEHGSKNHKFDVTGDDPEQTFKIVLTHMEELPDYYTRLEKMENEAKSVKTETGKDDEEDEDVKEETEDFKEKHKIQESMANRFKELCGLVENTDKKQLKNNNFQVNTKKKLLKEEVDPEKFDIVKFSNDGLGEKKSEEEVDLYRMDKKNKNTL